MNRIVVALAAFGLALCAGAQAAVDPTPEPVVDRAPSAEAMLFDLVIMRPLGLVGTVAGAAVFVVALPFELVTWEVAAPARRLVTEPAKFTFTRPLGDLD